MRRGRRANPVVIGAFVLGAVALGAGVVVVWGSGRLFRHTVTFVSYFSGSVNGLNLGAPVKFHGAQIGSVTQIRSRLAQAATIRPEEFRIPVWFDIDPKQISDLGGAIALDRAKIDELISQGLRAQLQLESFVTGVLYLSLDFLPGSPVVLVHADRPEIFEIPTVPTALERASEAVTKFMAQIQNIDIDAAVHSITEAVDGVNGLVRESAGAVSAAFPWVFAMIAGLSMFAGNILALRESNVKRVLAYSSIAHLGYILVAFLAGGTEALRAIAFYLVAYFATTLGAFAAIAELSTPEADASSIEEYRGLAARRPWLAAALTAMLLSLAGLPLTAGFVGKFVILRAGAGAELWILAVILAVNGTISIFYYLKIVSAMFRGFAEHAPGAGHEPAGLGPAGLAGSATIGGAPGGGRPSASAELRAPFLAAAALAALTLAVVALGVFPSPLLSFIGSLTTSGF